MPNNHLAMMSAPRVRRTMCTAGLCILLAASGPLAYMPIPAHAATAETTSELARLQHQVYDAAETYRTASANADALNTQVDGIATEILRIEQEELPRYQQRARNAASTLYKMRLGSGNMLTALFSTDSFMEFVTMGKYLNTVQGENIAALDELDRVEQELNGKLESLSLAKDQAVAEQQKATAALAGAKDAAAQMQRKADGENAAEAAAAAEAARQAAELEAQEAERNPEPQAPAPGTDDGSNGATNEGSQQGSDTGQQGESGGTATAPVEPTPPTASPDPAPEPAPQPEPEPPSNGGWLSGKASYYGIGDGFMGGTTANGDIVTETSMGVAMLNVPLGTRVEIRYKGRTVIAVVNDRGPYAHGRVIDMQPAVARALNFLSVGVDTVEYRFL